MNRSKTSAEEIATLRTLGDEELSLVSGARHHHHHHHHCHRHDEQSDQGSSASSPSTGSSGSSAVPASLGLTNAITLIQIITGNLGPVAVLNALSAG